MREEEAQTVLLVRAFEESDPEGRMLTREQRAIATRRAVTVTTAEGAAIHRNEETIARRARVLRTVLARKIPALGRVVELARLHALMGPTFAAVALLAGLSTNLVGPDQRVNLLAFPLLGLLAWNAGSYVLMGLLAALRPWMRRRRERGVDPHAPVDLLGQERLVHGLAGQVVRLALWRSKLALKKTAAAGPEHANVASRAFRRFCGLWHRATMPLLEARVRRRLHVAAMAMMAGVVVGMYVRGIALEYRATWESTWLHAAQVQWLMDAVLGPAAAVLGTRVPDVTPLAAPGTGPAAIWLHLYAISAVLFVGIPRFVLAAFEARRSARLKRDLPLDLGEAYYRRILADWRGDTKQIEVVPYSFTPSPRTIGHLKTMLHDFFGTRADIREHAQVPYGEAFTAQAPAADEADERFLVVLFNLAQSPETEVHGEFLEQLKAGLDERSRLLILVDVSTYVDAARDPARIQERLAAWDRVTRTAGLTAVDLDPDRSAADLGFADTRLAAVRDALWSARDALETG